MRQLAETPFFDKLEPTRSVLRRLHSAQTSVFVRGLRIQEFGKKMSLEFCDVFEIPAKLLRRLVANAPYRSQNLPNYWAFTDTEGGNLNNFRKASYTSTLFLQAGRCRANLYPDIFLHESTSPSHQPAVDPAVSAARGRAPCPRAGALCHHRRGVCFNNFLSSALREAATPKTS